MLDAGDDNLSGPQALIVGRGGHRNRLAWIVLSRFELNPDPNFSAKFAGSDQLAEYGVAVQTLRPQVSAVRFLDGIVLKGPRLAHAQTKALVAALSTGGASTGTTRKTGLRADHLASLFGRTLIILPEPAMMAKYEGWIWHHRVSADLTRLRMVPSRPTTYHFGTKQPASKSADPAICGLLGGVTGYARPKISWPWKMRNCQDRRSTWICGLLDRAR